MTKILALDPADRMGWAFGLAGTIPVSGSVRLRKSGDPVALGAANMGCFIRDIVGKYGVPDIIAPERYLEIPGQASNDAAVSQLLKHGAIYAMIGLMGVRLASPTVSEVRKHFCGKTTAAPRRRQKRTNRERYDDRIATNMMVLNRAILTGYLPVESVDFDRANACAVWDWASVIAARRAPRELLMFGQEEMIKPAAKTGDDGITIDF